MGKRGEAPAKRAASLRLTAPSNGKEANSPKTALPAEGGAGSSKGAESPKVPSARPTTSPRQGRRGCSAQHSFRRQVRFSLPSSPPCCCATGEVAVPCEEVSVKWSRLVADMHTTLCQVRPIACAFATILTEGPRAPSIHLS